MRFTVTQRAGLHERFAPGLTLPAPGALVPVRDRTRPDAPIVGTAKVVDAWRVSDVELALEVEADIALAEHFPR